MPKIERKRLESLYTVYLSRNEFVNKAVMKDMAFNLKEGVSISAAAALSGLSESTHALWMQAGNEFLELGPGKTVSGGRWTTRNEDHAEYYLTVKKALAEYQLNVVRRSLNTAEYKPTWVRDLSVLERKFRKDWGRNDAIKLGGEDTASNPDEKFL
jgi:transposase